MFAFVKLAEMLVAPLNMVLYAVMVAALLFALGRSRPARRLIHLLAAILVAVAILPWSDWLLAPLEERFPRPSALPERIDGVVVLGGAIDPLLSAARGLPSLNGAAERLLAMLELAHRYPEAQMVFSSGSGSVTRQDLKEAPVVRSLLESIGFDCTRVIFEAQSRNTWENAVFSRDLVRPEAGQTWLLVTSAAHMPRAMGAFRAAGWQIIPYPVDYLTVPGGRGGGLSVADGVSAIRPALHEWLGLIYYRARGWSDSWYPRL